MTTLVTLGDLGRLAEYRERLFAAIARRLAEDGHCKSYEGRLEVGLPNYFDREGGDVSLVLRCYVLGPSRMYEWHGKTLGACVRQAEADLDKWLAEDAAVEG
jgi:hypothetical protein